MDLQCIHMQSPTKLAEARDGNMKLMGSVSDQSQKIPKYIGKMKERVTEDEQVMNSIQSMWWQGFASCAFGWDAVSWTSTESPEPGICIPKLQKKCCIGLYHKPQICASLCVPTLNSVYRMYLTALLLLWSVPVPLWFFPNQAIMCQESLFI